MKKVMFIFMSLLVVISTFYFLSAGHLKPEKSIANKLNIPYVNPEILISPLNPTTYTLTSPYGPRVNPVTFENQFHGGVDLATTETTDIYAPTDGIVTELGYDDVSGNFMKITHEKAQLMTVYVHLPKQLLTVGTVVHKGDKIAIVGNTGRSTGPHLHFEIRKWDGTEYVRMNPVELIPLDDKAKLPQWNYPTEIEDTL